VGGGGGGPGRPPPPPPPPRPPPPPPPPPSQGCLSRRRAGDFSRTLGSCQLPVGTAVASSLSLTGIWHLASGIWQLRLTYALPGATILCMTSVLRSLLALQTTDTEIETCRGRVHVLQGALADGSLLARVRQSAEAARAAAAAADAALRASEERLERLGQTIVKLEKRLYDGSIHNEREAKSVQEELEHRRADRGATEDAVLAAMERVEEAHGALSAAAARLAETESGEAGRISTLKTEGRETMARLKTLQEQRAALAGAAPPALLSRYERLRVATHPAVVAIHDGSCGGCGVAVPTGMQQKVGADQLMQCINCNRILASG